MKKQEVLKKYENLTVRLTELRTLIDDLQNSDAGTESIDHDIEDAHFAMMEEWQTCVDLME